MTDAFNPGPESGLTQDGTQQPAIRILAQYVRDLSFENPRAPEALRAGATPPAIELVYAGLFQVVGVEQEDLEQVLMIECPRYLFPFARRLIADLSAEGGFPPLMLEPMDFAAIYLARKAQAETPQFDA